MSSDRGAGAGQLTAIFAVVAMVLPDASAPATRELPPGTTNAVIAQKAANEPTVLWSHDLGNIQVEGLQLVGADGILVATKLDTQGLPNGDLVLLDRATGQQRWRASRPADGDYRLLGLAGDRLLFQVDRKKDTSIVAVSLDSGATVWERTAETGSMTATVLGSRGAVLVVEVANGAAQLALVQAGDGKEEWIIRTSVEPDTGGHSPIVRENELWTFFGNVARWSMADGSSLKVAVQHEIGGSFVLPPDFDGDSFFLVDRQQQLRRVIAANGSLAWAVALPAGSVPTNVVAVGKHVFVRSQAEGKRFGITALSREDGTRLWSFSDADITVSNILDQGGQVHVATPTSLIALDSRSGELLYRRVVTKTGRSFPVHLRRFDERVVFVGELIVAAYDALTGKQIYRLGFNPLASTAHLNGIDASTANLEEEITGVGAADSPASSYSNLHWGEAARYQNLANSYSHQAASALSRGDSIGYSTASLHKEFAQQNAKMATLAELADAGMDVAVAIMEYSERARIETTVERQKLYRRTILTVHVGAESANQLFRPDRRSTGINEDFVAGVVVDLPTGQRQETLLSPLYLAYGLWNVVDFDGGVVYHAGLGLDPSRFRYGKAHHVYPYGKIKTLHVQLVAMPLRMPVTPQ